MHGHDSDDNEPEFNAAPYGGAAAGAMHHNADSYGSGAIGGGGSHSGYGSHHGDEETAYGGGGLGSVGSRYDMNTAYASGQAYESHGPAPHIEAGGPHAHLYSPPPAEDYGHPAAFPAGNYDNIGLRQV